jgi:hypothetical protein
MSGNNKNLLQRLRRDAAVAAYVSQGLPKATAERMVDYEASHPGQTSTAATADGQRRLA